MKCTPSFQLQNLLIINSRINKLSINKRFTKSGKEYERSRKASKNKAVCSIDYSYLGTYSFPYIFQMDFL